MIAHIALALSVRNRAYSNNAVDESAAKLITMADTMLAFRRSTGVQDETLPMSHNTPQSTESISDCSRSCRCVEDRSTESWAAAAGHFGRYDKDRQYHCIIYHTTSSRAKNTITTSCPCAYAQWQDTRKVPRPAVATADCVACPESSLPKPL